MAVITLFQNGPAFFFFICCYIYGCCLVCSSVSHLFACHHHSVRTPALSAPCFRSFRAFLFLTMGFLAYAVALHRAIHIMCLYPLDTSLQWPFYMLQYTLAKIPERWKPGAFDIAGTTIRFFHVFVVLGALAHSVFAGN